ncbi:MAG: ABC transporter permease subunit [Verrucomicrobia bacterium]|jgi:ABC-type transport system involved in multi-copper enzyme maturation permease subunit|nr:ABC transporter permease subunit [Verrucomicrobiota bacterium]
MRRVRTVARIVWLEMLRRKDLYVLLILLAALLFGLVSLDIFGLGNVVGFVKDAGFLAAWFFGWILATNCASRQLPQEESRGTILPLLAKPIRRGELIVGKWLGAWSVVSAAVACFYLLTVIIVWSHGGHFQAVALAQAIALHTAALGIVAALAIALSTRMHQDAASAMTYVMTAAMFLLVPRVPEMVFHAQGWRQTALMILYGALPHFELFDMRRRVIHMYGPMSWTFFGATLLYGAIVVSILLLLAWMGFRAKHFSRSNQD